MLIFKFTKSTPLLYNSALNTSGAKYGIVPQGVETIPFASESSLANPKNQPNDILIYVPKSAIHNVESSLWFVNKMFSGFKSFVTFRKAARHTSMNNPSRVQVLYTIAYLT